MSDAGYQPLFRTPGTSQGSRLQGPGLYSPVRTGILAALGDLQSATLPVNEEGGGGNGDGNDAGESGESESGDQSQRPVSSGQRGKVIRNTDVPDSQILDIDVCLKK